MNYLERILIFLFVGLSCITLNAKKSDPKTILVVSGWQDVNIGDIAHTPGLLHILETYLPDAISLFGKRMLVKRWKNSYIKTFQE